MLGVGMYIAILYFIYLFPCFWTVEGKKEIIFLFLDIFPQQCIYSTILTKIYQVETHQFFEAYESYEPIFTESLRVHQHKSPKNWKTLTFWKPSNNMKNFMT